MKVGLIINPIAGMGGSVGLKGTDGQVEEALSMGAKTKANRNTLLALGEIQAREDLMFLTGSGLLGQDVLEELGLPYEVVYQVNKELTDYDQEDTKKACRAFNERGIELLIFAGGDGTARNIVESLDEGTPAIGIPTGVKMQSAVFALRPNLAGALADQWIQGKFSSTVMKEVIDLDEDLYRENKISATLYGYLALPDDPSKLQNRKAPSALSDENNQISIAGAVIDSMEEGKTYIIGPGTTPNKIMEGLELPYTLLGFDLVKNRELVASDVNEEKILEYLEAHKEEKKELVLTPIGGQGMLLGRGNQQISPRVLAYFTREEIRILATANKMAELRSVPLYVDTGCQETDEKLQGYYRIVTDYTEWMMYKVR